MRGTKTLKSEQNTEKLTQLETELKEALTKIKELEKPKEPEKAEKKVTFSASTLKKDADALKSKQEELDKLKVSMKKVMKKDFFILIRFPKKYFYINSHRLKLRKTN